MLNSSICFSVLLFMCSFAFPSSRNLCLQISAHTKERHVHSTVNLSVQLIHLTGLHIMRPPWQNSPPCSHLRCSRFTEELTLKKQVSVWLKGAWEFNLYYSSYRTVSLTARPSSHHSNKAIHLKQYSCIALLLWLNTMKHAFLGEYWLEDSRLLLPVRCEIYCRAYVVLNSLPLSWPVVPVIS